MFKSFYLKDIFGNEPIRGTRLTKENRISGNIPLVTAGEQNEGIAEYISNSENQTLSNMLTIDMFGNCFYRDYLYKSDDNILSFGLKGKSTEEMLYIVSTINSICKKQYSYGKQYRKGSYLETIIPLPVIENPNPDHEYTVDDIDWQYMRDRITELERDRITELDAYLQATGLNDYELTEEDVRYGKFVIGEIFNSQNGDNNLRKADVNGKGVPIISAGVKNNGILGLSDKVAKVINANTITVDVFGNTYFRYFNYKMTRSVFSLELKEGALSEGAGIYICSELKQLDELFDYDNMCSFNKIKSLSIELPIKADGTPDFEYMERYIRAIEKVVIADVVKYKDRVIETTKKVVG